MLCPCSSIRFVSTSRLPLQLSFYQPNLPANLSPIIKRRASTTRAVRKPGSKRSEKPVDLEPPITQTISGTKKKAEKKLFSELPTRAFGADGVLVEPLERYVQESKGRSRRKKSSLSQDLTSSITETISSVTSKPSRKSTLNSLASELGPTGQAWPPLAKQVLSNLQAFPNCILLTRVGGFYESYFDQSSLIANMLGIKLATRNWGGRNVGMAGFPLQQLEKYLKILVQENGKLVAICEEFKGFESDRESFGEEDTELEDGKKKKKTKKKDNFQLNETQTITRRVTRVVSPGTLIDEKFLDPFRNNYILAVSAISSSSGSSSSTDSSSSTSKSYEYGLAWLDLSTADFTTTICNDSESLRDEVARIMAREIILEPGVFDLGKRKVSIPNEEETEEETEFERSDHPIWEVIDPGNVMISFSSLPTTSQPSTHDQEFPYNVQDLNLPVYTIPESRAVSQLTSYLKTRLLELTNEGTGMEMDLLASESPMRRMREDNMLIDAHTLSSLEIREAFRDGNVSHRGSLSSVMRGTVTRGGTRLLGEWLTSPSTSLPVIQSRHSLVALFCSRAFLRDDLRSTLRRGAGDISRVLQRITTRRNDEQDLLEIRDFIHTCHSVVKKLREELQEIGEEILELQWESEKSLDLTRKEELMKRKEERNQTRSSLESIIDSFRDLTSLGRELGEAIDERVMELRARSQEAVARRMEEEVAVASGNAGLGGGETSTLASGPAVAEDGKKNRKRKGDVAEERPDLWGQDFDHLIRPSTSKVLQSLTDEYTKLRREARILEDDLRVRFRSDKVALKQLMGQGYIVHLQDYRSRSSKDPAFSLSSIEHELSLSPGYRGKTTRSYYFDIWTSLGSKISRLMEEIKSKESHELERLRMLSLESISHLRKNSKLIDQLDVLLGFSQLASEFNLVRPEMTNDLSFEIKGGRHLSVELGLLEHGRLFHRNDCSLDYETSRVQLITGPNMGGKSTFLRQNALISILAQSGSFVPAEEAKVGIVDRVFSRVGAKDDLFRDRSTFMVEMQETGQILRRATPKSLVICDEVGRGTTTSVGLSIAFATIHELHNTNKCRTLFATHFHELADMLGWKEEEEISRELTKKHNFAGVDFFCTDVDESTPDTIVYSHSLRRGVNRESSGLKVARLAEMPSKAVDVADKCLKWLRLRGKEAEEEHSPEGDGSLVSERDLERLTEILETE